MPYVYVDIDMGSIDDDDLEVEYNKRFETSDERITLCAIYDKIITGKKDEAYSEMHDYLKNKLGKTL
jgi:hypothetical protein